MSLGNQRPAERRSKPRMVCNYPAYVRGKNEEGKNFEEPARVINMSSGGVYLLLNRAIPSGEELSIRIAMPTGSLDLGSSKLATNGTVVRGEAKTKGIFGIAVKFNSYRFV